MAARCAAVYNISTPWVDPEGSAFSYSPKLVSNATQPTVLPPFFARFTPFFRRSFALSGFLAPRRRERAKNGEKWAKFGGETGEKQRWLSGVGDSGEAQVL